VLRCTNPRPEPRSGPTVGAGLGYGSTDRYNAPGRLRNRFGAIGAWMLLLVLSLASAGCSLTMHLASLQADPETTGSTPISRAGSSLDPSLDDEDWRRAQSALNLAVDPQGSGQPVNWDNPTTKRKGSFAPAGNLVLVDNTVCRPFTATLVQAGSAAAAPRETRHSGQACRTGPGEWALRHAGPAEMTAKIPAGGLDAGRKGLSSREKSQPLPSPTSAILEARDEGQ
jgi:surface antigen